MADTNSTPRFAMMILVWSVASIIGLTFALLAVGLLGLWVLVGAVGGLGATLVCGWLGQVLFATDLDTRIAARGDGPPPS